MQNRVAIITGASKGIGKQTAIRFAKAGYNTVVVATNQSALQALKSEIEDNYPTECLIVCGDLSDMAFVRSIAETSSKKFNRIDVLVNNAAWRKIETMRTIEPDSWERTLRICITAPAFLAQSCAAIMEEKNIEGCIINISSIMSQRAAGNSPAYIASKGALESLSKELAVTYGRSGIRVVCLRPGYIDTELSNDYTSEEGSNISHKLTNELLEFIPANSPGTVQDIADAIIWLSSEQARYITGCELTIDGGFSSNFSSYHLKNLQFPTQY